MSGGAAGPIDPRQPAAPYLDTLLAQALRGPSRLNVPGHKGGPGADPELRAALGERTLALDVPQESEGIEYRTGEGPAPQEQAEVLAAAAHGAARTWFLTNGATQGNHALCLALAPLGAPVVVQRNVHASVVDGLVLSGGTPSFVAPACDDELGMAHGITPDALREALARVPGVRVAFVVSPTYYGMAADVAGLVEVAHAAGAALAVDQAWGPHFGFHPALAPSALALGADVVLTSTHKIVGSLGQSAMLHLGTGAQERVDVAALASAMRLVRSTSPSSLLLASLDAARRQLAVHGEALIERTLALGARARAAIDAVPGCAVVGEELVGRPGVAGWDPLRIAIDVRGTGCSGYEVAAALRAAHDVHVELASHAAIVLVLGAAEPPGPIGRFPGELTAVLARIARPGAARALVGSAAAFVPDLVVTPREAFLGASEVVALDDAVGRVSCEAIAGYPPGIPALLPGERIGAEVLAFLREIAAAGAHMHGASDPALRTIHVLRD